MFRGRLIIHPAGLLNRPDIYKPRSMCPARWFCYRTIGFIMQFGGLGYDQIDTTVGRP
jgi:hypothetical protein